MGAVELTVLSNRSAESADQDQTARMCRLILLYTIRISMVTNGTIRANEDTFKCIRTPDLDAIPAPIAQLVRALDLKTRGCGFDSRAG